MTSAANGNGAARGIILSFDPIGTLDEDRTFWASAVIENHTGEAVTVRLVHWGGNGIAPVLARHRAPNAPHAAFAQLSPFFSIDGGEVEVVPGVPVHFDMQFECVDDDRYMRTRPRSMFAFVRDANGTITNSVLVEVPGVRE